jgi:hypothetical protein
MLLRKGKGRYPAPLPIVNPVAQSYLRALRTRFRSAAEDAGDQIHGVTAVDNAVAVDVSGFIGVGCRPATEDVREHVHRIRDVDNGVAVGIAASLPSFTIQISTILYRPM